MTDAPADSPDPNRSTAGLKKPRRQSAKSRPLRERVFLLTDLTRRSGRKLAAALDEEIRRRAAGWHFSARHLADLSEAEIATLPASAVIADGLDSPQLLALGREDRKLITLSSAPDAPAGVQRCLVDQHLAGLAAADILLRRGHRKFAWGGGGSADDSELLGGFVEELARAGLSATAIADLSEVDFEDPANAPPPTAILADSAFVSDRADDPRTVLTTGRCIAGTADHRMVIEPSAHWQARALVTWLMGNGSRAANSSLPPIPPESIGDADVAELSSAFSDPTIAEISAFIDAQLSRGKGCNVEHIAAGFSLARRTLERRFRDAANTSIHREITRRQVARARQSLLKPNKSPAAAATESGYSSTRMLSINFRKLVGLSPRAFQRKILYPFS